MERTKKPRALDAACVEMEPGPVHRARSNWHLFSTKKIIAVVLPLLLVAAVACGESNVTKVPASATEQAPVNSAGEQAPLSRAAAALRSYRATFTVELLPSMAVERGTFEIVLPDRSHFTLTFSGGAMTNEVVIIGNDRYAKMGQSWTRIPAQGGQPRVLTTTGGLNQLEAFRRAAETGALIKGGSDTVNTKQCQIYSHSFGDNTFEYCVAENLPLRMKVTGASAIITFLFTDYNQALDINAPI